MKKFLALAIVSMLAITGVALAEGAVSGTVVDAEGLAVAEARVALQVDDLCIEFVYTDAEGNYLFEVVEDGDYIVKASKRRVGNGEAEITVDGAGVLVDPIALTAGTGGGGQGQGGQGGHGQYQHGGGR